MVSKFRADQLARYGLSDEDQSGDPMYYGYVDEYGNWYIQEHNITNGTYRYARGNKNYEGKWQNRKGLTYNLFNTFNWSSE